MKSEDARFEEVFERILKWYRDEEKYPLSDALKAELNRWKFAREWVLLWKPLTDTAIVDVLVQSFPGLSEPQAWRDVRNMKRFFASMEKTNREYDRIMLVAQIRDLRAKAIAKQQYKVAAQCDATLQKMGVGIEVDDESEPVSKSIELLIDFNPKLIGAKEIPNILEIASKYIGEVAARRELMMDDDIL